MLGLNESFSDPLENQNACNRAFRCWRFNSKQSIDHDRHSFYHNAFSDREIALFLLYIHLIPLNGSKDCMTLLNLKKIYYRVLKRKANFIALTL